MYCGRTGFGVWGMMRTLNEVACEVVRRFPGLTRTQLVKLVYLIDREYYRISGDTLTGVEYKVSLVGPTSDEFAGVLAEWEDSGVIYEDVCEGYYHLYPAVDLEPLDLDEDEEEAFESAIQRVSFKGELMPPLLMRAYTFSLSEVMNAGVLGRIEFER